MRNVVTTVRLPEKIIKILDERAKKEHLDRTVILREFLEESIKIWKIKESVKLYKEGKISLSEAAKIAELSIDEMMDDLVKRGIRSDLTVEEYKESLDKAFKLFKIKRKV